MKTSEREIRDLYLLAGIVLAGVILMFIAGQLAVRVLPNWSVPSDMDSRIDPNSSVESVSVAVAGLAPLRAEILTPAVWQRSFLTPLAEEVGPLNEVPVVVIAPATQQPTQAATSAGQLTQVIAATATATPPATPTPFPTNTLIYIFPTWTFTPKPPTATFIPAATFTPTFTASVTSTPSDTPTQTATVTETFTPSLTPTETLIPSPTYTPTATFTPITPDAWPSDIGTSPGGGVFNLGDGNQLTLLLDIVLDGNQGDWDVVVYELPNSPGIHMDLMIISISQDGHSWYTIFYWGDGSGDANANLNISGPLGGNETDNRPINSSYLYNNTGIAINADAILLNGAPIGTYHYLRITAPGVGSTDGTDIDAIQVLP